MTDESPSDESHSDESASTDDDRTVIAGRNFEREYRVDASEAGEFLIALGEGLRDGDDLRIETEEWALPFAFGEPVKLEIDYEGVGEPELEIEVALPGRTDQTAPDVR
ncbi:amphi-Trp domain-containing protein [Halorubrum sp. CSM-61]|uniref:amphi-Trp domain-containing protein n=1 Tax=Halorubrum sp. CSM-61 TaxID=2485838 RepID=UPI000F4B4E6B|nr:amphi-Trp domain-containing protein [Halorubrum sp. CSM-61]